MEATTVRAGSASKISAVDAKAGYFPLLKVRQSPLFPDRRKKPPKFQVLPRHGTPVAAHCRGEDTAQAARMVRNGKSGRLFAV